MKSHFHMKGWAPRLALRKRLKVIRKWPIDTSQLTVVAGANCSIRFLEYTPLHSFLIFSYVVLAIFASGNSNKSTKLHLPCGNLTMLSYASFLLNCNLVHSFPLKVIFISGQQNTLTC